VVVAKIVAEERKGCEPMPRSVSACAAEAAPPAAFAHGIPHEQQDDGDEELGLLDHLLPACRRDYKIAVVELVVAKM
jgi:hypothetical protein